MKKVALLFATVCLWGFSQAQESVIKLSGGDAAFGRYEISYERTFNEGMNNIKSSGKMRSQKAWPNILTKGSFQVSFSYISKKHSQVFGKGQIAVIDTNSNHHPQFDLNNPDHDDIRVNDDPNYHSIERSVVSTVSGIAFEGEYRSYIKTYRVHSRGINELPTNLRYPKLVIAMSDGPMNPKERGQQSSIDTRLRPTAFNHDCLG